MILATIEPLGGDVQVNTVTTGDQFDPHIAALPGGGLPGRRIPDSKSDSHPMLRACIFRPARLAESRGGTSMSMFDGSPREGSLTGIFVAGGFIL